MNPKEYGVRMFLTSCLYFGDSKAEERDKMLIRNWNETIEADDVVIVVGGFGVTQDQEQIKKVILQLKGFKGIILSPKDSAIGDMSWWVAAGFGAAMERSMYLDNCGIVLSWQPIHNCNLHNFFGKDEDWAGIPNHACVATDKWNNRPIRLAEVLKSVGLAKDLGERRAALQRN